MQNNAVTTLRAAENGALTPATSQSFYTGSGKSLDTGKKSKAKGKKKTWFVAILLSGILFGGGAFLSMSNSFLPAAIDNRFTEVLDVQNAGNTIRALQLESYVGTDIPITNGFTGAKKYAVVSDTYTKQLESADITRVGNTFTWEGQTYSGSEIKTLYEGNPVFRGAYGSVRQVRAYGFFDKLAEWFSAKFGFIRDWFRGFRSTGNSETDTAEFNNTVSPKFESDQSSIVSATDYEIEDEDGNIIERHIADSVSETTSNPQDVALTKARHTLAAVSKAAAVASWSCVVMRVGTTLSSLVSAMEKYSAIKTFLSIAENVSKARYGNGNESAINEAMNRLNTVATTITSNLGNVKVVGSGQNSSTSEDSAEQYQQTGSAMESEGVTGVLANAPMDTSKISGTFSGGRIIGAISRLIGGNQTTSQVCNIISSVTSIMSLVSIGVTIAGGGLFSFGAKILADTGRGLRTYAVGAFLTFIIPSLVTLFKNNWDGVVGIPFGEHFADGGSAYMKLLAQYASGATPSSKKKTIEYEQVNNKVNVLQAEVDRLKYSPFDITNGNTFFGSIAYQLIPLITSSKLTNISSILRTTSKSLASIMGGVSAAGEGSSFNTTFNDCKTSEDSGVAGDLYCRQSVTLDPSTYYTSPSDYTYTSVLMGTADIDWAGGNSTPGLICDENGDCEVQEGSNLANYIATVVKRTTDVGTDDPNIAARFGINLGAFGAIPGIGDIATLINNIQDARYSGWINGYWGSNTDDTYEDGSLKNPYWDSEIKYYQRYFNDVKLLDQVGAFEGSTNPINAFLEKDAIEHPVDNSYKGIIAQLAGLTVDDVDTTLAFVDYFQMLDEYDPSTRIAMENGVITTKPSSEVVAFLEQGYYNFSKGNFDNPVEVLATTQHYVVYSDLRNRNYAA